jgi:glycosyltransferase involved in cell wall biosynthesis
VAELDISVAVCTRNRAAGLERLLDSFEQMRIPGSLGWEVLVVDNGSADETCEVVESFRGRLPIRIMTESRIGLSHARNRAVDGALGRYLCWTDDDVIVPADWLEVYWRAFRDHPDAAVFGGRILSRAEGPHERWFVDRMREWPLSSVAAFRDLGLDKIPLLPRADRVPWGANYAVRAAEQRATPYDEALTTGEETDVIARILRAGGSGWWLPESRVAHLIAADRQRRDYVARYFRRAGQVAAYMRLREAAGQAGLEGAAGWTARSGWILRGAAIASRGAAEAARIVNLHGLSLRSLARYSYIDGVLDFRRGDLPSARSAVRSSLR